MKEKEEWNWKIVDVINNAKSVQTEISMYWDLLNFKRSFKYGQDFTVLYILA